MHSAICWCTAPSIDAQHHLLMHITFCWCKTSSIDAQHHPLMHSTNYWCTAPPIDAQHHLSIDAQHHLLVHSTIGWCTSPSVDVQYQLSIDAQHHLSIDAQDHFLMTYTWHICAFIVYFVILVEISKEFPEIRGWFSSIGSTVEVQKGLQDILSDATWNSIAVCTFRDSHCFNRCPNRRFYDRKISPKRSNLHKHNNLCKTS